jgi:hypothetical protein
MTNENLRSITVRLFFMVFGLFLCQCPPPTPEFQPGRGPSAITIRARIRECRRLPDNSLHCMPNRDYPCALRWNAWGDCGPNHHPITFARNQSALTGSPVTVPWPRECGEGPLEIYAEVLGDYTCCGQAECQNENASASGTVLTCVFQCRTDDSECEFRDGCNDN